MIDNIAVGKTIAGLRQSKGMTQQQLAAALNVSHQAVSKWENGAALPDIQTMLDLTRLFGITVEQLLNGEVPEDRLQPEQAKADAPKPASPIEGALRDIGNFVNGIFKPAEKRETEPAPAEEDGAAAAEIQSEDAGEAESVAETDTAEAEDAFEAKKLLQMAPFMSKETVDALLLEHRDSLTAGDIARFAPFASQECLETLIQSGESEINWDTLRRVAPFLKREMVDALAKAAAKGEKLAKKAVDQSGINTDDLGRTLGDVSQKIGSGMEKAIRKAAKLGGDVANGVSSAFNDLVNGGKARDSRAEALRRAAFDRALQDEQWDWIAAHIGEIDDEELLRSIAQKANGLGMHDWVLEHMNGYADTRTIDAAIEADNWGWLGDHVWQFEDALQEKVALAAAQAENWQWISTYAEQIALENCADQIGIAAYRADAKVLARQLAERCMDESQREALASEAVAAGDEAFLGQLLEHLSAEYVGRLCVARAQEKKWDRVETLLERADRQSVEQMMELAIAEGNFDAIDLLNDRL